ncbi:MAG: DUF819 family protein [Gemmatimonadota bacterium]
MMIESPAALAALIAAIAALAFWLDLRFGWARTVGAAMLVVLFGAVVSNLGLVPFQSPVYDIISGPVTSLAIVWLLFAVDVRDLKEAGPAMLGAFTIAVLATATGAVVAALVFSDSFQGDTWKLAGVMTGTYAGGSLNFVAVGRELDFPPALFSAATASDAVMTAVWFGATLTLPVLLGKWYPAPKHDHHATRAPSDPPATLGDIPSTPPDPMAGHPFFARAPLRVVDLSVLMALGFGLLWAAESMLRVAPGIPTVLWLTTFALAVGHLPWVRRFSGAMHLGSLGLHLFLVIIGIASRFSEIARVGFDVFWFAALVIAVHGVVTYGAARLVGLDVETTSVASQAAVGGPASALALAVGRDWKALVLPGVVVGLLGYAVGNYLGLGVAYWMQRVLVG